MANGIIIPTIRRQVSGIYTCQLRLGHTSQTIKGQTEAECRKKAIAAKSAYQMGKATPICKAGNKTLGQVIDDYINDRDSVLSPSTIAGYKDIRRNRFKAYMGRQVIDINNWQAMINTEAKLGVAPKTVKNALGLVTSALKSVNITIDVTAPQVPVAEHKYLTPEQIKVFVAAAEGDACEIMMLLMLSSLRTSEVMGLMWDSVGLDAETIRIHGARVKDADGKLVAKETNKNRTSDRRIPILIPRLAVALRAVPDKTGYVATRASETCNRHINAICAANGFPLVGNHGLRHSFASLAYTCGLSEKATMAIGGWADYRTMRNIYTHLGQGKIDDEALNIKAFFTDG